MYIIKIKLGESIGSVTREGTLRFGLYTWPPQEFETEVMAAAKVNESATSLARYEKVWIEKI